MCSKSSLFYLISPAKYTDIYLRHMEFLLQNFRCVALDTFVFIRLNFPIASVLRSVSVSSCFQGEHFTVIDVFLIEERQLSISVPTDSFSSLTQP